MKRDETGKPYCDLSDIIRINQLVRKGINSEEFLGWYDSLSDQSERDELTLQLFELASQSGANEKIIEDVLAELDLADFSSGFINNFKKQHWYLLDEWFREAKNTEKLDAFKIAFHLFGVAEAKTMKIEAFCNHWWHRDILDPKVVESLLNDPNYYLTSKNTELETETSV